jgi:hypothetical protein
MRLERLVSLPTPVQPSGRREERPPRREPEASERHDAPESPPAESADGEQSPNPPGHIDIRV